MGSIQVYRQIPNFAQLILSIVLEIFKESAQIAQGSDIVVKLPTEQKSVAFF
jgi:hypothetical protein